MEGGIRRVVWVPKELDEEIEKARHKIGYTRSGFYRYAITRFLEDLLIHKTKEINLQAWEEIVGVPKEVKIDNETTTAVITCTQCTDYIISYPNETKEAEILQTLNKLKRQKIAILRTNLPHKPLIIRTLNEPPESYKLFCASLVVRPSLLWIAFKLVAFNNALWYLGWR